MGDVLDGSNDQRIMEAVGSELFRTRTQAGLTRPELCSRLKSEIGVQALATYEKAVRHCSIARFVEICQGMGADASDVLSLARQRNRIDLQSITLQVNLLELIRDRRVELLRLRKWALAMVDDNGRQTVRLDQADLCELAAALECEKAELVDRLVEFTPQSAIST